MRRGMPTAMLIAHVLATAASSPHLQRNIAPYSSFAFPRVPEAREPLRRLARGRRLRLASQHRHAESTPAEERSNDVDGVEDTVRVRIWRALARGDELSMAELSKTVGERRRGELRAHLTHVDKQAKTLRNKSAEWRIRRGLPANYPRTKNLRLKMRRGIKNEIYIKLA